MWYVIQVMTGKEIDIAGKLKEQGIKALVPRDERIIRSGGSWVRKEYVTFSSYVFLDMIYSAENYYRVRGVPGVIRFLGDSQNPSRLSYLEAEWIQRLTGKDNAPIKPTIVGVDENGDLKAVKGVLKQFENRVLKFDRRSRRATVELTICGEKKEVQLSIELEEDSGKLKSAGEGAADGAATPLLKEAD